MNSPSSYRGLKKIATRLEYHLPLTNYASSTFMQMLPDKKLYLGSVFFKSCSHRNRVKTHFKTSKFPHFPRYHCAISFIISQLPSDIIFFCYWLNYLPNEFSHFDFPQQIRGRPCGQIFFFYISARSAERGFLDEASHCALPILNNPVTYFNE